jgi:hypothetical protein
MLPGFAAWLRWLCLLSSPTKLGVYSIYSAWLRWLFSGWLCWLSWLVCYAVYGGFGYDNCASRLNVLAGYAF